MRTHAAWYYAVSPSTSSTWNSNPNYSWWLWRIKDESHSTGVIASDGAIQHYMKITVAETGPSSLAEYGSIPSVLTVQEVLDVVEARDATGDVRLVPRTIDPPYVKDYDAPPAVDPSRWNEQFDVSNWGILTAKLVAEDVGRAAIAWRTPGVELLEGSDDLAVLWDLRVHPARQRCGVGAVLFSAAAEWAKSRGARRLKVETQNVNAPACRFYEAQGCVLGAYHHHAYPELPHEIQILWYKDLATLSMNRSGTVR